MTRIMSKIIKLIAVNKKQENNHENDENDNKNNNKKNKMKEYNNITMIQVMIRRR